MKLIYLKTKHISTCYQFPSWYCKTIENVAVSGHYDNKELYIYICSDSYHYTLIFIIKMYIDNILYEIWIVLCVIMISRVLVYIYACVYITASTNVPS